MARSKRVGGLCYCVLFLQDAAVFFNTGRYPAFEGPSIARTRTPQKGKGWGKRGAAFLKKAAPSSLPRRPFLRIATQHGSAPLPGGLFTPRRELLAPGYFGTPNDRGHPDWDSRGEGGQAYERVQHRPAIPSVVRRFLMPGRFFAAGPCPAAPTAQKSSRRKLYRFCRGTANPPPHTTFHLSDFYPTTMPGEFFAGCFMGGPVTLEKKKKKHLAVFPAEPKPFIFRPSGLRYPCAQRQKGTEHQRSGPRSKRAGDPAIWRELTLKRGRRPLFRLRPLCINFIYPAAVDCRVCRASGLPPTPLSIVFQKPQLHGPGLGTFVSLE